MDDSAFDFCKFDSVFDFCKFDCLSISFNLVNSSIRSKKLFYQVSVSLVEWVVHFNDPAKFHQNVLFSRIVTCMISYVPSTL